MLPRSGIAASRLIDGKAAARLAELGFIEHDREHVTVTEKGMPLLDAILAELVAIEPDAPV